MEPAYVPTRNYVAFDIEIAKNMPDGEDWLDHRPLGITCAALYAEGWDEPEVWAAVPQMDVNMVRALVDRIYELMIPMTGDPKYTVVTWNGLGFDFDILTEEAQDARGSVEDIVRETVDMMFHVFCAKGYPCGLDAAAQYQGVGEKPPGMTGADAPRLWADREYSRVIEYLKNDVVMTAQLARICEEQGYIRWLSRRGNPQTVILPDGRWPTVRECLAMPEPDNSWMTDPWPRSKFTDWMEQEREAA